MNDPLAALARALTYRARKDGLDPKAMHRLRMEIAAAPPEVTGATRAVMDSLMAYTVDDMPPLTDDVSLLVDVAAYRHGLTTRAEVWRRIGIPPNTGKDLTAGRADRVNWPTFYTLRSYAMG